MFTIRERLLTGTILPEEQMLCEGNFPQRGAGTKRISANKGASSWHEPGDRGENAIRDSKWTGESREIHSISVRNRLVFFQVVRRLSREMLCFFGMEQVY